MFAGPPIESAVWSDSGAEGVHRFLRRLWTFAVKNAAAVKSLRLATDAAPAATVQSLRREIHLTLKQASFDYERLQYNTVVSAAMKMLNALESAKLDCRAGAARVHEHSAAHAVSHGAAHHPGAVGGAGFAREHGDLLDAPWPQPDPAALRAG